MTSTTTNDAVAAALAKAAAAEAASPLPAHFDDLLSSWIRETLSADAELTRSADSLRELDEDIARIGERADHYVWLRATLVADIEARRPEPQWWIVDDISRINTFAVAADPVRGLAFALRKTSPDPEGTWWFHDVPDGTRWSFAVLPLHDNPDASRPRHEFAIRVSGVGQPHREEHTMVIHSTDIGCHRAGVAQLPAELSARPDDARELSRGWAAFGSRISVADE